MGLIAATLKAFEMCKLASNAQFRLPLVYLHTHKYIQLYGACICLLHLSMNRAYIHEEFRQSSVTYLAYDLSMNVYNNAHGVS